jgi:transaldolase / glucose-6-phosphate isomerase
MSSSPAEPRDDELLGPLREAATAAMDDLAARDAVARAWAGDSTLWQEDPTEVADRLGWLHVVGEMRDRADDLRSFAAGLADEGATDAVVMGMGGSSLFPEVLARSFPVGNGGLRVRVLDTTDPAAVRRVADGSPEDRTFFLASSKSGTTLETRCHLELFLEREADPARFAAVTDPGSELAELARERGFRAVFENRPDIGGRYSALSYFGLVPAALQGVDVDGLLASAAAMADGLAPGGDPTENPALRLGAILGAGAQHGFDKVTLLLPEEISSFGLWVEQLLAESTGKDGTGVIPVVGEEPGNYEDYGRDRLFVSLGWHPFAEALADREHPVVVLPWEDEPLGLGAHVLLWELATALCGAVLGINPFDQPNVAEAKDATAKVLADGLPDVPASTLDEALAAVQPGDYVAIQAYVDPEGPLADDLAMVRTVVRQRTLAATTLGFGPRFLHSTGQLHKGGPPTGVFVQVVGDDPDDLPVPGRPFGFSGLKHAQAAGDFLTLRGRGLRVHRVAVEEITSLAEELR